MSYDKNIIIQPNFALTTRQFWISMFAIAAIPVSMGLVFLSMGYWLILPFAGLEAIAIFAVYTVLWRKSRWREHIFITDEWLELRKGYAEPDSITRIPRLWTQVILEPSPKHASDRVLIIKHGYQRIEVGSCLTTEDKRNLWLRLKQLVIENR